MTFFYSQKYAGFFPRLIAVLIDSSLLGITLPLMVKYLSNAASVEELISKFILFITYVYIPVAVLSIVYYVYSISHYGKTLGKAIVGIEVLDQDDHHLSPKKSFFRELIAKPVSGAIIGVGFLATLVTEKQQAWHDLLANTYAHRRHNGLVWGILALIGLSAIYGMIIMTSVETIKGNTALIEDFQTKYEQSQMVPPVVASPIPTSR